MQHREFPEGFLKALQKGIAHRPRLDDNRTTDRHDLHRVRSGELLLVETYGAVLDLSWTAGLVATYWQVADTESMRTFSVLWTREENTDLADALIWARTSVQNDALTSSEELLVLAILLGYELSSDLIRDEETAELRKLLSA